MRALGLLSLACLVLASSVLAGTARSGDEAPLRLERGDVVCLLGNALAERMQHHGWLEARLQARFAGEDLVVRNLGFGGDELTVHQRTLNFGKFTADGLESTLPDERFLPWDRYLDHCDADVVFAFFGFNESFAGLSGVAAFRRDLETFVDHVRAQRYGDGPTRLVLFGPLPFEDTGRSGLPEAGEENGRLVLYDRAMERVAKAEGVRFVDLFGPMQARYETASEPLTIDGVHLNERGNAVLAEVIEEALFGDAAAGVDEALRAAVLEKNGLWFDRYRATDGYNTYGGRSRQVYVARESGESFSNFDVLQREMDHLDVLVANRDRRIHALARGEPFTLDDSNAPPLVPVGTNLPGDGPGGAHEFLGGEAAIARMQPGPGLRVELFADEARFPQLVNPVQMSWDTAGRLWVAVWPTYPHRRPGEPRGDALLVLEDVDGDGRADSCTTFADDLHNPTGFEHWNGGVLLAAAPDLLFLEDTDGDGRADRRERLLHGLSSADTHHSANSFVFGPDGALYFQEGTFHQSQIETVRGPVRNRDGCVWRFEPRTFRVERYVPYDFANPHGHVFDAWGQDFVTDGTGNVNYWALPFSGYLPEPLKHAPYFPFFQQRSRPAAATEILSSRHFADADQGNYLIANVIGFRGIFRYRIEDDGAGFTAVEREPIVSSEDPNFRPVDLEVGPDGALYFLDWHNPLIGHLQHHIRDPGRDRAHGRVYRVVREGAALLEPPAIDRRTVEALFELLRSPEARVRYRARIELGEHDSERVVAAARRWALGLDANDPEHERLLLEALWTCQQHGAVDRDLLTRLLVARDSRARAAAVRVVRTMRHALPDALDLLAQRAEDTDPRVRLEVVVAASSFDSVRAVELALASLRHPTDRFLDYALSETVRALEPRWKAALRAGRPVALGNEAGFAYLLDRLDVDELASLPRHRPIVAALLVRDGVDDATRLEAADALAARKGTTRMAELVAAIGRLDGAQDGRASATIAELGRLALAVGMEGAPRPALETLARAAERPATRAFGYAALVVHDRSADQAWVEASRSSRGLRDFLAAVALLPPEQRERLYGTVRELAIAPREETADAAGSGGAGLEVGFHEPAPADATRETFERLVAVETLRAPAITADVAPARESDSFGLAFRGTLLVPSAGEYTFHLRSDDGSRLYLGDACVVDNDGDHALRERSGSIRLAAGAHALLVTFFESGGDEGLALEWEGPGFAREPVPPSRLEAPGTESVRAAAVRALAAIPGHDDEKLADAARFLAEGGLFDATLALLASVAPEAARPERVRAVVEELVAWGEAVPVLERNAPRVVAALDVARELVPRLPAETAAALRARLDALAGRIVVVRTVPHQMLYDVTELEVEAGRPITLVFENDDVMPHNLVITAPGALVTVGEAAERLAEGDFVPDSDAVLWHTRLLRPGESESIRFVAPAELGEHPYLCTYPGHWRVMNGIMRVVERAPAEPAVVRREGAEPAPQRAFVRDWTMKDLAPLFDGPWERGRSTERGRRLFGEAGCLQCHRVDPDEGSDAGPTLADIRAKYRDAELLSHVVEPSRDILPGYELEVLRLANGRMVSGRVVGEDATTVRVAPTLLRPDFVVDVPRAELRERYVTRLSPMPTGLLVTLDQEEILDLVHFLQTPPAEADRPYVVYEGTPGLPGNGKHVVLLAGDEEYRSEEALPMLARILAVHHGFRCTVLFATDPETGEIDPEEQTNVPGMHLLAGADLLVCFLRFRELPDEAMAHFVDYVESGKPIVGIRTATHAFAYGRRPESPYARYSWDSEAWPGGFGRQVLGETWVAHHGKHGSESTRGVPEAGAEDHPVLRGVDDVWGPTDVYRVTHLDGTSRILLRGQVLAGMQPDSPPVAGEPNDPMMPLVWIRELPAEAGAVQRVLCSTIGASVDLESEGLRRLFVNGCYWAVGLEDGIPPAACVDFVGAYEPSPFGFGGARPGRRAVDFELR